MCSSITIITAGTNVMPGSRPRSSALVWLITSAGSAASYVRASTKNRTIELMAATSIPLPLTSPTSSATERFGSRQMPKKSPPPAAWPEGSNTSPASNPSSSGSGPGTKPRVSASATRRSRAKSSALAIAPAAATPERLDPREQRVVAQPRALVGHGEHAEQPRADRERHVRERLDPLLLDHPRQELRPVDLAARVRLAGLGDAADHPLADHEARLPDLLGEPERVQHRAGRGWRAPGG